jgi:hypothetical protein
MHVIVKHQIKDPEAFFSIGRPPAGVTGRQMLPSRDRTEAVCLFEAESIDAVRDWLEPLTRSVSNNTYFEVDAEYAMGLPGSVAV